MQLGIDVVNVCIKTIIILVGNMWTQTFWWGGLGFLEASHVTKKGFNPLTFLMTTCLCASITIILRALHCRTTWSFFDMSIVITSFALLPTSSCSKSTSYPNWTDVGVPWVTIGLGIEATTPCLINFSCCPFNTDNLPCCPIWHTPNDAIVCNACIFCNGLQAFLKVSINFICSWVGF